MIRVKYPRTPHLPWSLGATDDDKVLSDTSVFEGQSVVVSEKMDGECTTIYSDGFSHARSLDSTGGIERDWVKRFAMERCYLLPHGWRICGENLFARHSIVYDSLPSYFLGFSIWNSENHCLSWAETVEWCQKLGISTVPVLYEGTWNTSVLQKLERQLDLEKVEGYVVRKASSFSYDDFGKSVAKFVRKDHVKTDKHWRSTALQKNGLLT